MTTLGERGLLSHPSVFAISCLLFELCFSLLFSLRFNFPKGWIDPTYFLLTVSLESHSIGQAELFTFMLMYPSNTKMSEFYCILLTPFLFFSLQGLSVKAAFRNKDLGLVLKERWPYTSTEAGLSHHLVTHSFLLPNSQSWCEIFWWGKVCRKEQISLPLALKCEYGLWENREKTEMVELRFSLLPRFMLQIFTWR